MFGVKREKSGSVDWSNLSIHVKQQWDNGNYNNRVHCRFAIFPNEQHNPTLFEAKYKKYRSCYYEVGSRNALREKDTFLRESGYDYFPVLCPRWNTSAEYVYGVDSPGEMALGDTMQLQVMQKRKARAVELGVNPPMVAHPDLRKKSPGIVPGHINWTDESQGQKRFRSAIDMRLDINHLTMDIQDPSIFS